MGAMTRPALRAIVEGDEVGSRSFRRRLGRAVGAGLLGLLVVAGAPGAAGAQEALGEPAEHELEARILAQRHDDDRVEFVMQFRVAGEQWSDSATPERRFLDPTAEVEVWFAGSPLTITSNPEDPSARAAAVVRVVVQVLSDGRIEFALQQRHDGATWSERIYPARRFFTPNVEAGRWVASAPVVVTLTAAPSGSDVGVVQVSDDVLDFDMIDVHTGEPVNIRSVVTGRTPLLFWLWSPY